MALTNVTTTFNLKDYLGETYKASSVRVRLTTNAEKNLITDKSTGEVRLGGGTVTLAADGSASATHWAPGADANPASWQTTYHIDFVDTATKKRQTTSIGPFTVTTSGLLSALIDEQAVPATYLTTVTAQLDTYTENAAASATSAAASASSAATSADLAQNLVTSDLGTTDGQTRALIEDPASQTATALSASFGVYLLATDPQFAGGATGDGVADDTTAIQAAIDACATAGGGVVWLPAGTYLVSAPLRLSSHTHLRGAGSGATTIKLAVGANCNVIETQNFAAQTGQNLWLVSEGVAVGFGISGLTVDGNRANNSSGRGVSIYGKRYQVFDVITNNCAGDGFYSECGYKGGQTVAGDLPEGDIDMLYSRENGGNGITHRGPHDNHIGSIYPCINDGHGFVTETALNIYNGQCDVDFIHSYANAGDGVQLNAPGSVVNLQSESNYQRNVRIALSSNIRIGMLYAYKAWRSLSETTTPIGNANVDIESTAGDVVIGEADIRSDYGGTALKVSTNGGVNIGTLLAKGENNTSGGIGLDLAGNNVVIGVVRAHGFSATGGIGVRVANNLNQVAVAKVETLNNKTHLVYLGTGGARLDLSFGGYVNTGEVDISGTPPLAAGRLHHQFGGPGAASTFLNHVLSGSGWQSSHPQMGAYHLWFDAAGRLRVKGSAPTSDTDGTLLTVETTATTAQLTSATSTVNTVGKVIGKHVYDSTVGRPVWSRGSAATSIWVYADGTTAHTPA